MRLWEICDELWDNSRTYLSNWGSLVGSKVLKSVKVAVKLGVTFFVKLSAINFLVLCFCDSGDFVRLCRSGFSVSGEAEHQR